MGGEPRFPSVSAAPEDQAELIREVRHATGNLVQRAQYWATILGDQVDSAEAVEALVGLRSSVEGIHRLATRAMDLMRKTETRPVCLPAAEVACSIALRFGVDCDRTVIASLAECGWELNVDSLVLDHALGMLDEVLIAEPTPNGRSSLTIELRQNDRSGRTSVLNLMLRLALREAARADAFAHTHAQLTLALALKLLAESGCNACSDEAQSALAVHLSIPITRSSRRRVVRSTHKHDVRDSRDPFRL
jgi:hypothetical protein